MQVSTATAGTAFGFWMPPWLNCFICDIISSEHEVLLRVPSKGKSKGAAALPERTDETLVDCGALLAN